MRNHRDSIVELGRETIKTFIEHFSLNAFADETDGNTAPAESDKGGDEGSSKSQAPAINYEDLIAKARKEEKDKQYKAIEKLKGQINTLTEQHNNDLLKIAGLEEQVKTANDNLAKVGTNDSQEVENLKNTIADLQKKNKDLEEQVKNTVSREEVEKEIRAELETEYEVKTYKAEKLAELKDEILVPELVYGDTKEEIDASIAKAKERSAEIRNRLGYTPNPDSNARTPKSPANPSVSRVQDNKSALDKLATLDVRSPEYAKLRSELGLR
jgi:chromosome segregation ATPase